MMHERQKQASQCPSKLKSKAKDMQSGDSPPPKPGRLGRSCGEYDTSDRSSKIPPPQSKIPSTSFGQGFLSS